MWLSEQLNYVFLIKLLKIQSKKVVTENKQDNVAYQML